MDETNTKIPRSNRKRHTKGIPTKQRKNMKKLIRQSGYKTYVKYTDALKANLNYLTYKILVKYMKHAKYTDRSGGVF